MREVLAALRIPIVEREGFEADDVLATLAVQARAQGHHVLICSGDRDTFQLVSDDVTVLYPIRGVSELSRMTPAAVEARYGVPPERYSDLAALVGEDSDNLPGVPGVGPKTAAKWITTYGDLDGIVANVDQIGGKAGESLRAHLDGVLRNRRLNGLVRDLELPLGRRRPGPPGRGTASRCTSSSTTWSSGSCASGCSPSWRASSPRPRAASTWPASGWRRTRWPAGWPTRPRSASAPGVASSAPGAGGPATPRPWPWPPPTARRRTSR